MYWFEWDWGECTVPFAVLVIHFHHCRQEVCYIVSHTRTHTHTHTHTLFHHLSFRVFMMLQSIALSTIWIVLCSVTTLLISLRGTGFVHNTLWSTWDCSICSLDYKTSGVAPVPRLSQKRNPTEIYLSVDVISHFVPSREKQGDYQTQQWCSLSGHAGEGGGGGGVQLVEVTSVALTPAQPQLLHKEIMINGSFCFFFFIWGLFCELFVFISRARTPLKIRDIIPYMHISVFHCVNTFIFFSN